MDAINALFEAGGALAILVSVARVLRDRSVAGVSWVTTGFFSAWGIWNLWFYPAVGAGWSFYAGILVVAVNVIYLSLLLRYRNARGSEVEALKAALRKEVAARTADAIWLGRATEMLMERREAGRRAIVELRDRDILRPDDDLMIYLEKEFPA